MVFLGRRSRRETDPRTVPEMKCEHSAGEAVGGEGHGSWAWKVRRSQPEQGGSASRQEGSFLLRTDLAFRGGLPASTLAIPLGHSAHSPTSAWQIQRRGQAKPLRATPK